MGGVKLIATAQSFFCTRVQWALKLKGVDYEFMEEDLRNKSSMLLKYNPVHKKVPVFVHYETAIAESLVILEYIDETWKESPLLPKDPYERAVARFWAKFADEKVVFNVWTACKEEEGEDKEKAKEAALESLAHLEKLLERKKFFGGEQIGYLDLVVGWIPHWLSVMEEVGGMKLLEVERFPCLLEWSKNFIHTPLIKECIPHRENLVEYLSASVSYLRSLSANKA